MLTLAPTQLTEDERALRSQVREFLAQRLPEGGYEPGLGPAAAFDREFSRALGARGWLGMSLPVEYGGGGRSAVERFVVVEQLLAAGAPVGFHWVADRQSGPGIARFGTAEQKARFLPGICRGELCFAIGMSEPDAGSDLAALRTRAVGVTGGWRLSGTKIWTSGAAHCDWLIVLCRTSDDGYAGLTQLLVDRRASGVTVTPIRFIDGTQDFCEVTFDSVFVPAELVLGEVGGGWAQNTAELALERGGPDRWLSTLPLLRAWIGSGRCDRDDEAVRRDLGEVGARLWALRGMSLSIARAVDAGASPTVEAALVKEMGTGLEQHIAALIADHTGHVPDPNSSDRFERLLAKAQLTAPAFTIRGGTDEVLRGVVAKGLRRGR
ncbi:acyl-CoA dehydrogenase [Streptomyces sp. HNM0575]|uniref:acyl-CoA dehydrogenase family protein n=1 Tax=Streptomyces sp. HNM0575 TaxID=2716338 RepID=UPI00145DE151|nr:acyl-CoA dehydrogenase family protein [Streptomyces sp. HNM0575]NLU74016.1 acyl-CoA dehydrogenase [Streptomyces sp. HNM0575]